MSPPVSDRLAKQSNLRPPRQSRSQASTTALLDIGRRLIEERGIDDCSMSDVAMAAGSSVGALYFRFGNKERFVDEIMQRHLDTLREQLNRFLDDTARQADSPAAVIEALIRWIVRGFERNQGLLRAQIRRALDQPQQWQPFMEAGQQIVDGAIRLLARFAQVQQDPDWQRQVRVAMQLVYGTLNNMVIHRPGPMVLNDQATSEELCQAVIRYLRWG